MVDRSQKNTHAGHSTGVLIIWIHLFDAQYLSLTGLSDRLKGLKIDAVKFDQIWSNLDGI
jgi:hypothetical protein